MTKVEDIFTSTKGDVKINNSSEFRDVYLQIKPNNIRRNIVKFDSSNTISSHLRKHSHEASRGVNLETTERKKRFQIQEEKKRKERKKERKRRERVHGLWERKDASLEEDGTKGNDAMTTHGWESFIVSEENPKIRLWIRRINQDPAIHVSVTTGLIH
jgi:hypothetical protein